MMRRKPISAARPMPAGRLVRTRYDDGGFSGGSTDRPALQQLLQTFEHTKINVIVVYKVDRLTRSLADFAKLVELFDAHGVSFVSVTQQFNTTTSMGRLTLNVLLSFAQFEREVTSERIRDKIGASKRKGLWVGGVVPLGLSGQGPQDHRRRERGQNRPPYLSPLPGTRQPEPLAGRPEKNRSQDQTPAAIQRTNDWRHSIHPRGPLAAFLRNRFYIGEVRYKGEIFPGEQTRHPRSGAVRCGSSEARSATNQSYKARQQSHVTPDGPHLR